MVPLLRLWRNTQSLLICWFTLRKTLP
jgi:hypothetical protein